MGTEISLDVGGISIDWSKNSRGNDHRALFQTGDIKNFRSDQINYDYFKNNDEDPFLMEEGFTRPLRKVTPRLELLGFTLDAAAREYEQTIEQYRKDQEALAETGEEIKERIWSFAQFCDFVAAHPIDGLDARFVGAVDAEGDRQIKGRFADESLTAGLPTAIYDHQGYSERSHFGSLINILHPYSILRVLAGSPKNQDAEVTWQYGPLVEAGWADKREFVANARRSQTFLIATEGSSDAFILKHALSLLRPEIADFFRFIDVSERHPFPGTGNLSKFAEGLVKIDVQNQVLFLFDNDAEGFETWQRVQKLALPSNMRSTLLPDLKELRAIPVKGPDGIRAADINKRAAAIECYLDLTAPGLPPPEITWINFKKELDCYHGALQNKEVYTKRFLEQRSASAGYDFRKLHAVLDELVKVCVGMSSGLNRSNLKSSVHK